MYDYAYRTGTRRRLSARLAVPAVLLQGAAVKYYLEADTITGVADGAVIAAADWVDKSIAARGGLQALVNCIYRANGGNGRPAIEFDGSTSYARSPSFAQAQPHRVFAVGKTFATTTGRIFDGNTLNKSTLQVSLANSTPVAGLYAGTGQTVWDRTLDIGYPSLMDSLFSGASSSLKINENLANSPNTPGTNGFTDGVILGAAGGLNAGTFLNGQIYALVVCSEAALTADDKVNIRAYLTAKHGCVTRSLLLCDGNSLTAGTGSSNAALYSYPAQLQTLLGGAAKWRLTNKGVGSQTTQQMSADAAVDIDIQRLGFAKRVLVAQEIGNDIIINSLTAAQAYANFETYCQARRTQGWDSIASGAIVATTVFARNTAQAAINDANALLRANWASFATILVDLAADPRLADHTNTTYFADGVHLTDAGYAVVAGLIYAALVTAGLVCGE